jgi:pimeloyl-ACP methyl ester carboxylesterase
VQPFYLETSDNERLFCWHVLPLDVYLQNEEQLATGTTTGEVVDELKGTVGEKLLRADPESRVVVNFHGVSRPLCIEFSVTLDGLQVRYLRSRLHLKSFYDAFGSTKNLTMIQNAGHLGQGWRPSTYRSISGIPHTHLLTCDYRGFGLSTLNNAPHLPTETGLITDAVSLLHYVETDLKHPTTRTVLLGQSLGTAVTAASALYFADPSSPDLPSDLTHVSPLPKTHAGYAGIILVAPFRDLATLLETYAIGGIIPIMRPLRGYRRIATFLLGRIVDHWPTLPRLRSLLTLTAASKTPIRLTLLHARNDQDIDFRQSEALFQPLQSTMLAEEGVSAREERRSIHGAERVKRGAFAFKRVEDARGERVCELEVVRFGGHNEVVGWTQVSLAVRRAFEAAEGRAERAVGLDVE